MILKKLKELKNEIESLNERVGYKDVKYFPFTFFGDHVGHSEEENTLFKEIELLRKKIDSLADAVGVEWKDKSTTAAGFKKIKKSKK